MNLSSGIIHIAVDIKLLNLIHAGMAELADASDLGSGSLQSAGSIPVARTILIVNQKKP